MKFHIGNGTIQVQNLDSNTDYSLRISGEGNVSLDQVSTSSQIHVETGTGNITLNSVSCQLLSGNIHTGNLHCYEQDPGGHLYELACENGMVYLLEQSQGNTYTVSDADDSSKIQFSVINGNIHLNQAEK